MDEITVRDGIPVTTVPRTLLDLAAVADLWTVERAMNEAEAGGHSDALSLPALLARHPRRRGAATIRTILDAYGIGLTRTRSELEARFVRFLDLYGLPRPAFNQAIALSGRHVEGDCVWRAQRLVVELDGRTFHDTAATFEHDRARDRVLAAAGWRVIRVTWRQLHDEPAALAADLRRILTSSISTIT